VILPVEILDEALSIIMRLIWSFLGGRAEVASPTLSSSLLPLSLSKSGTAERSQLLAFGLVAF